ncbi:MAG: methyl-accepting chemotaxis protein [Meiothermus silvanus]|nr:methyl-accepting chemotaxis protein [Allomeiothermus silvanus]
MDRPSKGIFRRSSRPKTGMQLKPKPTATQTPSHPALWMGGWLENTSFSTKLGVYAAVFFLTTLVLVGAGLWGLGRMSYHLNTIYQSMLASIAAINRADAAFADVVRFTELMRQPQTPASDRRAFLILAQTAESTGNDIIAQYNEEWVSTVNPGFTDLLRSQGQLGLQQQEVEALKALNAEYQEAQKAFTSFVRSVETGQPDFQQGALASYYYTHVRGHLREIININDKYAQLSNSAALNVQNQAERVIWVAWLLSLLLGAALTVLILRSILPRLRALREGAEALQRGEYGHWVAVSGRDEVGVVAATFNEAARLLQLKTQADAERLKQSTLLQQNISEFLDVAMEIAQGDLTRRGRVTEDVLGSVVDAINLVLEEMGGLLKDVQKAADLVNQGAGELVRTSAVIVQGAQSQAQIAQQAQGQAVEVSGAIRQMAERAAQTTEAARRALQAAQAGQTAVQNTLVGMQGIRREVSNISKGIKGLSDRSLEISEIIETISGFAAQTNLLALNAAIEAAGAGEAGTRFAIVAEEVRRLAEDSAKAAQRVTTLIGGIQAEIQAVASSVEAGTKEVEEGYRIANQAGERLQEIAQLTTQSAQLVQAISQATQTQAQRVAQVGQAVQIIAGTAIQTQEQSLKGRQAAEQLRQLAEQLSRNLARFRLPA